MRGWRFAQPRNPFRLRGGLLAQSRGRPSPSACEQVRADGKGLSPRLRRRPLPHGHESGPSARHKKSRKGTTSLFPVPCSLSPLPFREGATRRFRVPAKRGFRVLWLGGDATHRRRGRWRGPCLHGDATPPRRRPPTAARRDKGFRGRAQAPNPAEMVYYCHAKWKNAIP